MPAWQQRRAIRPGNIEPVIAWRHQCLGPIVDIEHNDVEGADIGAPDEGTDVSGHQRVVTRAQGKHMGRHKGLEPFNDLG